MSLSPEQYRLIKSECEKYVKDVENCLKRVVFFEEELNCYVNKGFYFDGKVDVCLCNLKEDSNKSIDWQERKLLLKEKIDDCEKRRNELKNV